MSRGNKLVIGIAGVLIALVILAAVVLYSMAAAGEARVNQCRQLSPVGAKAQCEDVRW